MAGGAEAGKHRMLRGTAALQPPRALTVVLTDLHVQPSPFPSSLQKKTQITPVQRHRNDQHIVHKIVAKVIS